ERPITEAPQEVYVAGGGRPVGRRGDEAAVERDEPLLRGACAREGAGRRHAAAVHRPNPDVVGGLGLEAGEGDDLRRARRAGRGRRRGDAIVPVLVGERLVRAVADVVPPGRVEGGVGRGRGEGQVDRRVRRLGRQSTGRLRGGAAAALPGDHLHPPGALL